MTGRLLIAAGLLLVLACSQLPRITPAPGGPPPPGLAEQCGAAFPQGKWQVLHSIRAEMPGGRHFMALGLTVFSSGPRTSRSVIMTFEGFVVFDGEYDGRLIVHRALPPFDSPHFAGGLMEDIRLIFFEPQGPVVAAGKLDSGASACRRETPDGGSVDLARTRDGQWELRRYDSAGRLTRTVSPLAAAGKGDGFPETVALTAFGDQGYQLVLTLVEAVAVESERRLD